MSKDLCIEIPAFLLRVVANRSTSGNVQIRLQVPLIILGEKPIEIVGCNFMASAQKRRGSLSPLVEKAVQIKIPVVGMFQALDQPSELTLGGGGLLGNGGRVKMDSLFF